MKKLYYIKKSIGDIDVILVLENKPIWQEVSLAVFRYEGVLEKFCLFNLEQAEKLQKKNGGVIWEYSADLGII